MYTEKEMNDMALAKINELIYNEQNNSKADGVALLLYKIHEIVATLHNDCENFTQEFLDSFK